LSNTIWHVQHKTLGSTVGLSNYVSRYDPAWHERLYVPAARLEWQGEAIGGTILNCLRKSKTIHPEADFLRYYVTQTEESVERFKRDASQVMERIKERRRTGRWEQNPQMCMLYNRPCAYLSRCKGLPLDDAEQFEDRTP